MAKPIALPEDLQCGIHAANGFPSSQRGIPTHMIDTCSMPRPGQLWLSCPPYSMIARVLSVRTDDNTPVVSYELLNDEGFLLERIEHAVLDRGWWKVFQPMVRREG